LEWVVRRCEGRAESDMTTEVLLNLVWLLIAAGLVGTWRLRWVHQRRRNPAPRLHEWSAVALTLVLLFFAVSMSDDMHAEIVALEECSANRRDQVHLCAAHHSAISPAMSHDAGWLVAVSTRSIAPDSQAFAIRLSNPPSSPDRSSLPQVSRAPPLSLL